MKMLVKVWNDEAEYNGTSYPATEVEFQLEYPKAFPIDRAKVEALIGQSVQMYFRDVLMGMGALSADAPQLVQPTSRIIVPGA